jgi:hypothetical protein
MNRSLQPIRVAILALLLGSTVLAGPASADPVTKIEGNYNGIMPPMSPQGNSMITFTVPASAMFTPDQQGIASLTPNNLAINLGDFATSTTVPVTFGGPLSVTNDSNPSQIATFSLSNGLLTINSMTPFSGTVTATATYVSDSFMGSADLGLFKLGGDGMFEADYSGLQIDTIDIITAGPGNPAFAFYPVGTGTPSAHFVLTPGAVIPEPASLALWGVAGLAGVGLRSRRRKSA